MGGIRLGCLPACCVRINCSRGKFVFTLLYISHLFVVHPIEPFMTAPFSTLGWSNIVALGMLLTVPALLSCTDLGMFEGQTTVGNAPLGGSASYDSGTATYTVTGSGANIYGREDAFHFLWKKVSGDLVLTTDTEFVTVGGHAHKKAGWMVRADLSPDAIYADAMVHGDSLIVLQYRTETGGITKEVQSAIRGSATMQLERTGDLFTLYVSPADGMRRVVGSVTIPVPDSAYAGLVVCSHDAEASTTVRFSGVGLESREVEERKVESTLETIDIVSGERRIVRQVAEHLEAPNWVQGEEELIYNSGGRLFRLGIGDDNPTEIDTGFADRCNNDHGLSPDGTQLVISHPPEGGSSLIYTLPVTGGVPKLVTPLGPSYWHGWSPDGKTLVYCALRNDEYDVYAVPAEGGDEVRLTTAPGLDDGPEYSPDGETIYFNSVRTGTMRIWRMEADGANQRQVTSDSLYADWFPHPSPDGKWITFLSYDSSVEGHPANKNVVLRIMPADESEAPRVIATLFGGQGTINVPSWSADSRRLAFVSYRLVGA